MKTHREGYTKLEGWSGASTNQGRLKIVGKPPEAKKKQGRILLQVSEEAQPWDTLISGF